MALANQITLERAFLMLGKEFPFVKSFSGENLNGEFSTVVHGLSWSPDGIQFIVGTREIDENVEESLLAGDEIDGEQFFKETGLTIEQACQYIVQGLITEPSDSDTGIPAGVTVPLRSTACPMGIKSQVYKRVPL